jgi:Putative capsular polysaccharide synthesis protein
MRLLEPRLLGRRVVGRSYAASKQVALWRMHRREPPIVVFSMGKTGSTAIARAMRDATGQPVFQVFRLEPERLAQAERRYRAGHPRAPFAGAHHLWESEYLLRRPPSERAPWVVITTVREPIAQAVSAFFHRAGGRERLAHDSLGSAPSVDELVTALVDEQWTRPPVRWFDREFEPGLGIAVYDHPFDPAAGYGLIDTPAARVLLLRQEDFAAAPAVLARFLHRREPVPVPARNESRDKVYGARYREFLAAARLPAEVLDRAYSSRYARHFYADSELDDFRRRWSGSGPSN